MKAALGKAFDWLLQGVVFGVTIFAIGIAILVIVIGTLAPPGFSL
jgi:membrane protein required for beta-lactamase induction